MALAYDNSTTFTVVGSGSTSTSYTMSSLDSGVLLVNAGTKITAISYGGFALGNIITFTPSITDGNENTIKVWMLENPPSGSNTLSFTIASSDDETVSVVSYTGVYPGSQPEAYNTGFSNNGINNTKVLTLATSVTTLSDNAWSVMFTRGGGNFPRTFTASQGTLRTSGTSILAPQTPAIIDSNGAITPAGSSTLEATWSSGSGFISNLIMSFAPLPSFRSSMLII